MRTRDATLGALVFLGIVSGCAAPDPAPSPTTPVAAPAMVVGHDGSGNLVHSPSGPATPVHRLTEHFGGEPSLGLTSDGSIFLASDGLVLRSRDQGESWQTVFDLMYSTREPVAGTYPLLDPWLWVDRETDRVFNNPLYPPLTCSVLAWSDDRGDSWVRRDGGCATPVMDHQKLVTGPPPDGAPTIAGLLYENVVYICYNKGAGTFCLTSFDGGATYPLDSLVAREREGCVNGKPAVSSKGVLVLPSSGLCPTLIMAHTQDAGFSYTVTPTGFKTQGIDSNVAFDAADTLYLGYIGNDTGPQARLARSHDLGLTWDANWNVAPPSVRSVAFTSVAAGDAGRLAYAFVGSYDGDAADPTTAAPHVRWHLFITLVEGADTAAPSFTTYQVTPASDPVQIGCIALRSGTVPCRNLIDFIDTAVGPEGTFYVAYTDGCTEGCANNPAATADDSRDIQTALAYIDGWALRRG